MTLKHFGRRLSIAGRRLRFDAMPALSEVPCVW
jgi:hypothetical protein